MLQYTLNGCVDINSINIRMNKKRKKIFIGVAWPYVNGDIHVGHLAGYLLPADIYARFHRFCGNDVLMASGSDCHGTPITVQAEKEGVHPSDIVERYHKKNLELFDELKLSFDIFTKTTTENHKKVVQDIFMAGLREGYIIKGSTKQYYSEEDDKFLPDRYVEGTCPHCDFDAARGDQCDKCGSLIKEGELKNPHTVNGNSGVILKETEHYFLDWSQLQNFLEKYFRSHSKHWKKWVKAETGKWLNEGLQPRAITRDISWGIELPIDDIKNISEDILLDDIENKRFYVWFEAVIGYLSASIEWSNEISKDLSWEDFWHNKKAHHSYFMGKDNLTFHTLFWPGQLHMYDKRLHLPDNPAINHFLNLENNKFSKSRGITIDSSYIVKEFGLDPVRFYITSIMPENSDSNFSWNDFMEKHNNVLIGNIGNFINRTLKIAENVDLDSKYIDKNLIKRTEKHVESARRSLKNTEFRKYLDNVLNIADQGNKYLSKKEPWKLSDDIEISKVVSTALFLVLSLQAILKPLLPDTVERVEKMTGVKIEKWPLKFGKEIAELMSSVKITEIFPLFNKIEKADIEKELEKIKK